MKISFCLITLNEEKNLARCLRSCADLADEILIVDSGSKDATEKIAREFNARWVHQDWLGYVGQKNKALSLASHEWVFSIDGDEELSPGLRGEVAALKAGEAPADVAGFSMPRCVCYEGKWIRHGDWYPDRLVRLFNKSKSAFAGGKVHERLEVDGRIARLRHDLHHYSCQSKEEHWARRVKYAPLWIDTQFEAGRRPNALAPISRAAFRWFRAFIVKRGFLDGRRGWEIAGVTTRDTYLRYQALREKWKASK